MDYAKKALEDHEKFRGKLEINSKVPLKSKDDLSTYYTPGVAEVSRVVSENIEKANDLTWKANTVAVVSDGSAVLGLGNIGPVAALPVMEGKAILFKEFARIDAVPICIKTQDTEEIISLVKNIAPTFGGINLEDISAPRCFEIESRLQDIGIPVFHDDQHGTAIVVTAALLNALKITGKKMEDLTVVLNGAGAAGIATAKMLTEKDVEGFTPVKNVIMCDSKGIISKDRSNLTGIKNSMLSITNKDNLSGSLSDAIKGADVFVGVSKANTLTEEMIKTMNPDPIIFAMANPIPEIMPDLALKAGAKVIGTGRSDFPNQINNVLAFPGVFRGALDARAKRITKTMKIAAIRALASCVKNPTADKIIPSPLDKSVVKAIADAVKKAAE